MVFAAFGLRKLAGEEAESSEAESSNENPDPSSHHEDGEVEDAAQDLWDLDIMDSPFPEVRPRDKEFCCLVCGAQSSNVLDINGPSDLLMLSLFPAFGPLATSSFSSVSSLCLSCNETWSRIADQIQALKEKKDAEAKKLESSSAQTRDRESDLKGKCLVCVICSGHVSKEGRGYNIYRHKVGGQHF